MKICYYLNRPEAIQDVDIFEGLIDGLELCDHLWIIVMYFYQLFGFLFWLVPIHYWGWIGEQLTYATFHQICWRWKNNLRVSKCSANVKFLHDYSVKISWLDGPGCVWHWWASTPQHAEKGDAWVGPHAGQWWAQVGQPDPPGCSSPACLGSPRCEHAHIHPARKQQAWYASLKHQSHYNTNQRMPFNRDHTLYNWHIRYHNV